MENDVYILYPAGSALNIHGVLTGPYSSKEEVEKILATETVEGLRIADMEEAEDFERQCPECNRWGIDKIL